MGYCNTNKNLYSPDKVHPVAKNEYKNNIKLTKLTRNNTVIHTAYIQHDVTINNIPNSNLNPDHNANTNPLFYITAQFGIVVLPGTDNKSYSSQSQ